MKQKKTINNILAYLIGNLRYKLYYSKLQWLIRWHILDQIEMRIEVMNTDCYDQGSCQMCGCTTTALQMANKSCSKPCYPPMLSKKNWIKLASMQEVTYKKNRWKLVKETRTSRGSEGCSTEIIYYIYKNSRLVHYKSKTKYGMGTDRN